MNNDYKKLIPAGFAGDSRVWIYQSNRIFDEAETGQIQEMLDGFVKEWHSHGTPVKGFGGLFFGQFIVLMADESATGVSGCSTDSSVRLIKETEKKFHVTLFDRVSLAFFTGDKIQLLPLSQVKHALETGLLDENTPYFNNTVLTRSELESKWIVPVKESWLAGKFLGERIGGN
ncbi:MAG TPA: hypothetical protein VK563_03545 [Puia sp.]|nr:hypothetical protein [Puia sp.]